MKLRLLLLLLLFASFAKPMERWNGQCRTNSGPISASCTVTVYNSGTLTLSSIFSDNGITPQANPFTAASNGQAYFYAADAAYDIRFTAGTPSISTFTIGAVTLGAGTGAVTSVFTRTGAVVAASADYTAAQVTNAARTDAANVFGAFYMDLAQIAAPTAPGAGTRRLFVNTATGEYSVKRSDGTVVSLEQIAGSFAPVGATFITQVANTTLTNEFALASLATGILKNTTSTGVLSIAVGADLPSHTHVEADVTNLGTAVAVPQARTISTTTPLGGGGDLTANRTLTCTTCEVTTAKDGASGYAGLDGSSRSKVAAFPALTGDATTPGGSFAVTLANTAVTPGTFTKLTVDAKGRATAGTTLVAGDLPAHVHAAADVTTGQLALARGGANADLSATGGTNQVLKQNSAGAAITVGTLALGNLSDVASKRGNGTIVQMAAGTAPATNDCAKFDADDNLVSAGGACGLGAPNVPGLTDLQVTRTAATVLTIGAACSASAPCNTRIGGSVFTFTAAATATISAGTGTGYIYIDSAGVLTVGHNVTLVCSGCTATGSVVAFPATSIPLWTWTATTATWDASGGSDKRAMLSTKVIAAGTGIGVAESGGVATVSFSPQTQNGATWGDGTQASIALTYNLSAGDPVVTYGNNIVNVTTGLLQQGGASVVTAAAALTSNGVIIGQGAQASAATAAGTADQIFRVGGGGGAPAFGSIDLTKAAAVGTSILPVANGGSGLASGTSGGVLGYTAAGTLASSAALAVNGVVIGGGAGATPTATVAGTANQVFRVGGGGGAPAFGAVDVAQAGAVTGILPVANGGSGVATIVSRKQTFCSGTATSSVSLILTVWNSGACTNTTEGVAQEILVNSAGTIRNLRVKAGTAGFAAGSGVVTIRKNAGDTIVACTVGVGTTCADTVNTATVVAGDLLTVKVVTVATETLADVQVSWEN